MVKKSGLFHIALIALTLISSLQGQAESSANAELCESIGKLDYEARQKMREDGFLDFLRIVFRSELYGQPLERRVFAGKIRTTESITKGENLIFSIGPVNTDPEQLARESTELAALQKQLVPYQKAMTKLMEAKSKDHCLALAKRYNFEAAQFASLREKEQALVLPRQNSEESVVRSRFQKVKNSLWLDWTLISSTDLASLRAALENPKVRNIILVSHSLSSGQLVDSLMAGAPIDFFNRISSGLLSVSIFACHSEKVVEFYKLTEQLKKSDSIFGGRLIFNVNSKTFLGRNDVTPAFAFNHFLAKVDARLGQMMTKDRLRKIGPVGRAEQATPLCSVNLSGVTPKLGEYGVYYGSKLIGVLTPLQSVDNAEADTHFELPCPDLQAQESPNVLLRSLAVDLKSDLRIDGPLSATIFDSTGAVDQTLASSSIYRRKDGTIKSLRLELSTPR